ncbi:Uncharacterised protein [uncultured archaeon]|nr:Uncharacterised protein [uncultured archaeon]
MKAVNYTAKILSDGHLSLPQEIRQELDLSVNTLVKVTLKIDTHREKAIKAFGAWSDRTDIKNGIEYTEKIRSEWDERKED